MLKLKRKTNKPTIDGFRCPECRGETRLVFTTETKVFFKCLRGHRKNGRVYHDVAMVPKSFFEGVK